MPSFAALGQDQIGQLVDYLLSLKEEAPAAASAGSAPSAAVAGQAPAAAVPEGPQGSRVRPLPSSAAPIMAPFSSRIPAPPATVPAGRARSQSRFDGRNDSAIEPGRPGRIQPRPEGIRREDRPLHPARLPAGRPQPALQHAPLRGHQCPYAAANCRPRSLYPQPERRGPGDDISSRDNPGHIFHHHCLCIRTDRDQSLGLVVVRGLGKRKRKEVGE